MILALLLALSACGGAEGSPAEQLALELRGAYLGLEGCTASLEVTADYGQRVYRYAMDLSWQREGETVITLTAPQEVAGVTARLREGESALEYDGVRVETGPLDTQGLSPLEAPPLLLETLRTGFLAECVLEDRDGTEVLHLTSRDPERAPGDGRELQLWLDAATGVLLRGEIAWEGETVIQCDVTAFSGAAP